MNLLFFFLVLVFAFVKKGSLTVKNVTLREKREKKKGRKEGTGWK